MIVRQKAPARNGRGCFLAVEVAKRTQGTMVRISDDDMIEHFDFQKLSRTDQIAGHLDVGLGRLRFAAGMIMHQHNAVCGGDDGATKHFTSMHQQGVHRANGDQLMALDLATRVQHQHGDAHLADGRWCPPPHERSGWSTHVEIAPRRLYDGAGLSRERFGLDSARVHPLTIRPQPHSLGCSRMLLDTGTTVGRRGRLDVVHAGVAGG